MDFSLSTPAKPPSCGTAFSRLWLLPLGLAAALTTMPLYAQTAVASSAKVSSPAKVASAPVTPQVVTPQIEGKTIDGSPFSLATLKGKVVLVMFWSTGCAVCRDKMPELRNNYEGWAGKPFELVAINTDTRVQDFRE